MTQIPQKSEFRRIGIFGGSFNPVHIGHLLVAQAAFEEAQLDRLYFVPAAQSPFKPDLTLAPPADRLALLHLALAGLSKCEIDDQELKRGGISYTIETVRTYRQRFPNARIFYLIGADHVAQLSKWRNPEELALSAEFLIIPRPGAHLHPAPPPFRSQALIGFPLALSASTIRERVRQRLPIHLLTPPGVAEAIANKRLYL